MLYQLFSTESNYLFLLQITYTFIYIENVSAFKYLLKIVIFIQNFVYINFQYIINIKKVKLGTIKN